MANPNKKKTGVEKSIEDTDYDLKVLDELPDKVRAKAGETEIQRASVEADNIDGVLQQPNRQSQKIRDRLDELLNPEEKNT